jgi:hypothetical protein
MRWIDPEENTIRLGIDVIAKAKFDPRVLAKVATIRDSMMTP